jgi:hypothetical protein
MSFLDDYKTFTSGNEAHPNYHLWCALVALSSIVSRRVYIEQGFFRVYANLYVVLVGPPGNRKTTAMSVSKTLMRELKTIPMTAECITKEALVQSMAENERAFQPAPKDGAALMPTVYTPYTVCVTELSQFVGASKENMIDFLTTIYDQDFYENKTKNKGTDTIIGPYLVVLACTTPAWITARLRDDVISGGFSRRALFVYETERGERIPFPEVTAEARLAWDRVVEYSRKLLEVSGVFQWDHKAKDWYSHWYKTLDIPDDPTVQGYYETKHMQLLKVAMLVSCSESTDLILRIDHLKRALEILDHMEINLPRVFEGIGRNELNAIASKVIEVVTRGNGCMPEKKVYAVMFAEGTQGELDQVINHLISSDKLKRSNLEKTITRGGEQTKTVIQVLHLPSWKPDQPKTS